MLGWCEGQPRNPRRIPHHQDQRASEEWADTSVSLHTGECVKWYLEWLM